MNELLQNAVKHGTSEDIVTEIILSINQDDKYIILEVTNTLLDKETKSSELLSSKGSLGFQLVQMLVDEIRGKIDIDKVDDTLKIKLIFSRGDE